MEYCYLNGAILPFDKAGIRLNDLGVLRGYGIFDFLKTHNGKLFLLKEHLIRFRNSAKLLDLELSVPQKQLEIIVNTLIAKNKFKETEVRLVLTGGPTPDGMSYKKPTLFILVQKEQKIPDSAYKKGIKLVTYKHQRDFFRIKTLNYITAVKYQKKKDKQNAFEILYVSNNRVFECTTSNIFIFKKDTLITPKDNILLGTTRNFVIKLAKKEFKIQEREIKFKEFNSASESFIIAANKDIVPVVKVNNTKIGNGIN